MTCPNCEDKSKMSDRICDLAEQIERMAAVVEAAKPLMDWARQKSVIRGESIDRIKARWEVLRAALAALSPASEEKKDMYCRDEKCDGYCTGIHAEAVAQRLTKDHPYYSASYGDVCRAVDREMALREELAEVKKWNDAHAEAMRKAEAEAKWLRDSTVPRSRYDVACDQYNEVVAQREKERAAAREALTKSEAALAKAREELEECQRVKDKAFLVARDADSAQKAAFALLEKAKNRIEELEAGDGK